ncbi:hypothetical protein QBC44DRAFT_29404 [Cladorrhinum sp. PSN332]|nr:hypothetical protein QBC44DRAFT_29404 [Cladorrhinum sp. PSN332]
MGSIENTQPFSNYESVYLNMSRAFAHLDKEHWGIHIICQIEYTPPPGIDTPTALSKAWLNLATEYPGLRMIPVNREKHFPPLDEQHWLKQTFFTVPNTTSNDIITQANKPLDHPSLYYLPATSEVILLIQHWRSDGLGGCMLLDRLFSLLASPPSKPSQSHDPSPSLESAAGASPLDTPNSSLQTYARTYIDDFHTQALNASTGLPYLGTPTTPPSHTSRLDLTFSPESTTLLAQKCKTASISVTAAIHTALAQTVSSYSSDAQSGYTTIMAVNMRPYLPFPYNTTRHACQTYVASITPTVSYSTPFLQSAAQLTAEYRTWHTPKFSSALNWIYQYHAAKLAAPPPPPPLEGGAVRKPPSGITLSSLGVINKVIKEEYEGGPDGTAKALVVEIKDFKFGVGMMTRQMILYCWTFRGRLTLSLSYNSAYYERKRVEGVLDRVKTELEGGLGVKITTAG